MGINLYQIQPTEDNLSKESVEYFLKNPDQIFKTKEIINILRCENLPFKYYVIQGHSRLYACHKFGIVDIPCRADILPPSTLYLEGAIEMYQKGVRTWSDYDKLIIPNNKR